MVSQRITFNKCRGPRKEIKDHALALPEPEKIGHVKSPLVPHITLGVRILEILGLESALVVVCHAVAAMPVLIEAVNPDAKGRVSGSQPGSGVKRQV